MPSFRLKPLAVKPPASQLKKRGRPPTGVKEPWKELNISKATYYRRIRLL
jgi:hypothetical protein